MVETTNEEPVGFIVEEAKATEFIFASDRKRYPPKFEYLTVKSEELVDGVLKPVEVLAQVERVSSQSLALRRDLDIEAIYRIKEAKIDDVKTWGMARILGYLVPTQKGQPPRILLPRRAVTPGNEIFIAPDTLLAQFYAYPADASLYVGNLISRPQIPVHIRINGFRRHVAILAQTGAGKSYLTGVLIEELMERGATIVIIDPHADYVLLSQTEKGGRHNFSDHVTVFQNPESTSRYSKKDIGQVEEYTVRLADLDFDEICSVCGIGEKFTNIRSGLEAALNRLNQRQVVYLTDDIIAELEAVSADEEEANHARAGARSAVKYVKRLRRLRVFSRSGVSIKKVIKPYHAAVMDLSGLGQRSTDYIVSKILGDILETLVTNEFEYPVFVVLEEAHNFVPPDSEYHSAQVIRRIAQEGRKFGIFLLLISQRPGRVHPDILSQCNSQIVLKITNPKDQNAIEQSSERLSADLIQDLPGLNIGEAVAVGDITRTPVMIKVRSRNTKEGGADIDVVARLKKARKAAGIDLKLAKERKYETKLKGSFSEV
ncbi:MAG: ATP-binding protein [Candidatus Thorarchaeota archaeon]